MGLHRHNYISLIIEQTHRNEGYGTEAIRWVLDWGFLFAELHRVSIESYSWNKRALRLYEKLGFKREACIREAYYHNGKRGDHITLGMLRGEWETLRPTWKGGKAATEGAENAADKAEHAADRAQDAADRAQDAAAQAQEEANKALRAAQAAQEA